MKPVLPLELDGRPLPEDLRGRFARLADAIHGTDPLRPAGDVRALAEEALRATCALTSSGWVSLRSFALDGGRGPSVRLR